MGKHDDDSTVSASGEQPDGAGARPTKQGRDESPELQRYDEPAELTVEQRLRLEALPEQHRSRVMALYQPVWIGYTQALEIRKYIERLMEIPYSGRVTSCAVVGPSYNGKTFILQNIVRRNNPKPKARSDGHTAIADREAPKLPVLFMQLPPVPSEDRLFEALLRRLHILGPVKESPERKLDRIQAVLNGLGVKLIAFDEFGFFQAGSPVQQRAALNAIKYLSNELRIPIVLSTVEAGLNILSSHEEIENRFPAKILPKWTADRTETSRLLTSFESTLGLKEASGLKDDALASSIVTNANYILGHIHDLLRLLAEKAILSGAERITEDDLKPDALKAIGWVHPTLRSQRS